MINFSRASTHRQVTLFEYTAELERRSRLNATMDRLNLKYGRGTLMVAAAGTEKRWSMRRQNLSPPYTTDWDSIPDAQ